MANAIHMARCINNPSAVHTASVEYKYSAVLC